MKIFTKDPHLSLNLPKDAENREIWKKGHKWKSKQKKMTEKIIIK
jgi:hypothetical protein